MQKLSGRGSLSLFCCDTSYKLIFIIAIILLLGVWPNPAKAFNQHPKEQIRPFISEFVDRFKQAIVDARGHRAEVLEFYHSKSEELKIACRSKL